MNKMLKSANLMVLLYLSLDKSEYLCYHTKKLFWRRRMIFMNAGVVVNSIVSIIVINNNAVLRYAE